MTQKKPSRRETLQAKFNQAVYRMGVMEALGLVSGKKQQRLDKCMHSIDSLERGLDHIRAAQDGGDRASEIELYGRAAEVLKASYVRETKAIVRKLDTAKIPKRLHKRFGIG